MNGPGVPGLPDRYVELVEIGRGGMGRVLRAFDRELTRPVAVKVLVTRGRGGEWLQRFRREARVQALVEHPNLVRVYDFHADDEAAWLVMELVDGETVAARIEREGRLPADDARRLGIEVGRALDVLHRREVLHRDIKPANVMLRKQDGSAVLMDLGLAGVRTGTAITGTGQMVGTPAYLPPEAFVGGEIDAASDQFQLGALLFEALVGTRLLAAETISDVMAMVCSGSLPELPPAGPALPGPLREAVARTLAMDRTRRFASVADFVATLEGERRVDATRELAPAPPPPPPPPGPGAAPPPAPWRLALGGFALLAVASALVPSRGSGPPTEVRIEVVGDAVVASFAGGPAEGVLLDVGDQAVPAGAAAAAPVRRAVFRGLPPGVDVPVRLRWPGGAGFETRVRADEDALGHDPTLAAGHALRVQVRRPVDVVVPEGLRGDGGAGHRKVDPPEATLPAPAPLPDPLPLEWVEQGEPFRRELPLGPILARVVAAAGAAYRDLEVERVLVARFRKDPFDEAALDPYRAYWAGLAGWVPELLGSARLERRDKRALFGAFETWHRFSDLEATLEGTRRGPVQAASAWGARFEVRSPPGADGAVTLPFGPIGGYRHSPDPARDGIEICNDGARVVPSDIYQHAAAAVELAWPAAPAGAGATVALAVRAAHLLQDAQLEIREEPFGPGGFEVHLWHPTPKPLGEGAHEGWSGVLFPAAMAPDPGAKIRIRMVPMVRETATSGWIQEVAVSWAR